MNKSLWSSSFSPSASSSIVHFLKYSPSSNQMFGVLGGTSAVYSWGSPYCLQMLGYTMLCLFVWQPPELCPFSSLCPYTLGNTSVLPSICYFICGLVISVLINYKFLLVTRSFLFFQEVQYQPQSPAQWQISTWKPGRNPQRIRNCIPQKGRKEFYSGNRLMDMMNSRTWTWRR